MEKKDAEWTDMDCPRCGNPFIAKDKFGLFCCLHNCGWSDKISKTLKDINILQCGKKEITMPKKIDGLKCEKVIDKLFEKVENEKITSLKKELKLTTRLRNLYITEIAKWIHRDNVLIIKISKIKEELNNLIK